MRAIQLTCYHTRREAQGEDRVRIQATIDRLIQELELENSETERLALRHRIGCLKGNFRMPRG